MTQATEHPFAQYIRILGRGKKGARSLTLEEAQQAMAMIMADEIEPVQLGAFLMLLRVKEESPEELAGFIHAVRDALKLTALPTVQIDWPSYAGKRRHLPWFVLSALLLAANNIPVFMHGTRGNKDDRIYTEDAVRALGLPICSSIDEARTQIDSRQFTYVPLEVISPKLTTILALRRHFGLRSPINTLLRVLNPSSAPYMMQSTFHPGYRQVHQQAAELLQHANMSVFKGEGGEIERDPDKDCELFSVFNGQTHTETWPALFSGRRHLKSMTMDINELKALWQNDDNQYGYAAVTGTVAIALRLLGQAENPAEAQAMAETQWQQRPKDCL